MINIIKHRSTYLSIAGTFVAVSIAAIAIFGLKPGIDFTGGTLWQIKFENESINENSVKDFFVGTLGIEDVIVYRELTSQTIIIKLPEVNEQKHQEYLGTISQKLGKAEETRFETIGPTVGDQLRSRAIWAVVLVLLGISIYIAFAFRKASYPVQSWKYGIVTLLALTHDVLIPSGILAVLGYLKGIEIDTNFVVALLVIVGFSVHDTIVVFDRIRENILLRKGNKTFDEIVNDSINQTFARSINTSLTLVLVLLAMVIFGAPTLKLFTIILLVGVFFGTYSSIFIASPLLTLWYKFGKNK